ncbi:hypothetical protein Tco_1336091 [Tanacetum coccineum]
MNHLEFFYWLALKFDNYKEIEKNTQNGLWEFYVNEHTKGVMGDLDDEPRNESYKKECLDTFYKPYLDIQDAKDIYEIIDREYTPIPIPAPRDIDNPDELCKTEEFTVVRHSIRNDEEFVTNDQDGSDQKSKNVYGNGSELNDWMKYKVPTLDAAESVSDAIRFEYCLASSSGWKKLHVLWAEIGESSLTGPELVLDMTDKVVLIKEKLKAARDRQKSYADNRRKPLEFEVGDRVMLKVSPWKGVIRFRKKGKLAPRYVGPFEILERVSPIAYQLRLPEELSGIKVDKTLRFIEEPVKNSDREVKRLKYSRMVVVKAKWLAVRYLVKVSWNSKCNFELTWVWEDYLKDKFDNQSIERDRLIGIGFVLDFVEFISFTFSDKEMILVIEAVMAISVISISSDSSEDSVGTPIGREIPLLRGDTYYERFVLVPCPTTIPDKGSGRGESERAPLRVHASGHVFRPGPVWGCDSLVSRAKVIENQVRLFPFISILLFHLRIAWDTYWTEILFESDPSEDPSSDHIPPLPATSPFLSSDDDPTDSDTPDTPSSPTHDTPFTEITASTQRSPTIPHRRVMLLASGQPIPYGRPYRYHLNGPVHMMTARKRVRPLPTYRLAERHSTDHSSSDSSSEASSDFHSDAYFCHTRVPPFIPSDHTFDVMAISVISISSDSSEDSVGTPIGREILFGTIPTTIPDTTPVVTPLTTQTDTPVIPTETPIIAPTIPPSPDYTPASPDYSPASDSESDPSEDPSSDHIPPLPATSPFLSSDDDPTDSDTPDTPSSPTHDTPFTEITASTQRSPTIPHRRVMLLASGQPIFLWSNRDRYHLMGDSSSEASSDFHSDASSDPSSRHSLSDHSSPDLPGTSAGPSRKRRRSPMTSVPALSPVAEL